MTCLVPEGKHCSNLTVAELDHASKALGCNVLTALRGNATTGEPHPRREAALAHLAYLWARRQRPDAQLSEFTGMELPDVVELLGLGTQPAPPAEDPDDPSPSPSE